MKLSQTELINQLTALTGAELETVKKEYDTLLDEILCLEDGQSLNLPGLGVFARKAGDLSFSPDESLADEINIEYAGQQALKAGGDQLEDETLTEADLPPEEDIDEEWAGVEQDETIPDSPEDEEKKPDEAEKKPIVPAAGITGKKATEDEKETVSGKSSEEPEQPASPETKKEEEKTDQEAGTDEPEEPVKADDETSEKAAPVPPGEEKKEKVAAANKEEPAEPQGEEIEKEDDDTSKTVYEKPEAEKEDVPPDMLEAAALAKAEQEEKKKSDKKLAGVVYPDSSGRMPKTIPADKVRVEKRPSASRRELSAGFTIAAVLLAALLLFSVGYVIFSHDLFGVGETAEAPQKQVVPDTEPLPGPEDIATAEPDQTDPETPATLPEDVTAEDRLVAEEEREIPDPDVADRTLSEPVEPAATPTGEYGLRGSMDETLSGAFGLVVHSLRSRSVAESEARQLRENGYRATTYSVDRDGTTRWRVSVGQFSDVASAQRAAADLPSAYRDNYFVHRIPR